MTAMRTRVNRTPKNYISWPLILRTTSLENQSLLIHKDCLKTRPRLPCSEVVSKPSHSRIMCLSVWETDRTREHLLVMTSRELQYLPRLAFQDFHPVMRLHTTRINLLPRQRLSLVKARVPMSRPRSLPPINPGIKRFQPELGDYLVMICHEPPQQGP